MSLSLLYSLARRGRDTLQSETSLNFSFSVHGVKTTNLLVLSYFFPQGESSRPRGRKVVLSAVSEQCYSPSRGKWPTDENRANKSHCAINHGGYPRRPCKGGVHGVQQSQAVRNRSGRRRGLEPQWEHHTVTRVSAVVPVD